MRRDGVAANPTHRRVYAEALLDVAAGDAHGAIAALGLGTPRSVGARLEAILGRPAKRSGGWAPVGIVLAALLLLPARRVQAPAQQNVVAVLARAVSGPDPDVRRSVANALREVGGAAAEHALRELIADADPDVRRAARSALGLQPERPKLRFPEDEPPVAAAGEIDSLSGLLTRGDADARLEIGRRLGNLRDARALRPLQDRRADAPGDLARTIDWAIDRVRERLPAAARRIENPGHEAADAPLSLAEGRKPSAMGRAPIQERPGFLPQGGRAGHRAAR